MIKTIATALEKKSYDTLTPVQTAVSDPSIAEQDLLVSAQTGSGKTVGFGLAIAQNLLGSSEKFDKAETPLALVIAPTRELALQVKRELDWLFEFAGAIVTSCVGGMDMRTEKRALERGAHIVVATPGRLCDHIKRNSLNLSTIKAIVLDEADEMLDLGFREDLEFILENSPSTRRTLMFSATVPNSIIALAKNYQRPDSVRLNITTEKSQHTDIEYRAMRVGMIDAENAIINVLRYYEATNALVFCNTRASVNRLTSRFLNRGFQVVSLSGELSQQERTNALQALRDGRARVCVATDVAARGIDLPNLELVIHAELPTNEEILLHRSGRTGRAGRKGVSALIVPVKSQKKAERLLRFGKLKAEWCEAPTADDVRKRDEERMFLDPVWEERLTKDETPLVEKLTKKFSTEQIALAYLRLCQKRQTAPEELSKTTAFSQSSNDTSKNFGPSDWFSIPVGRNQNAEARWLLPLLCRYGNLTKDDIGAIRIQPDQTVFEILKEKVPKFIKDVGPKMLLEDKTKISVLDQKPHFTDPRRERSSTGKKDFSNAREERTKPRPNYKKDGSGPKKDFSQNSKKDVATRYKPLRTPEALVTPDKRKTQKPYKAEAVSETKSKYKQKVSKPSFERKANSGPSQDQGRTLSKKTNSEPKRPPETRKPFGAADPSKPLPRKGRKPKSSEGFKNKSDGKGRSANITKKFNPKN